MLPTQSMDGILDQQSIIIDATPAIAFTLGETTQDTIVFFQSFMKIPNYNSRYMSIHSAADLEKALQIPSPESYFQVGDSQLKAIRGLANIFDAETKIPNRDALPTPPRLSNKEED